MRGTVADINHQRGMVGVRTEMGDHSVFELLGEDEIHVGDKVSWTDDTANGDEMLTNHTTGHRFTVYFQNHWVTASQLRQQLLYEDA